MRKTIARGFGWGLLATLAMTAVMLTGVATGMSPMPRPVPVALAAWAFGALPLPALMALGMVAHFIYGGAAGAVLAAVLGARTSVWSGLGFGALLWLGMGVIWLPVLGWGLFGSAISPRIGLATLLLHLIYGAVLGWGTAPHRRAAPEARGREAA